MKIPLQDIHSNYEGFAALNDLAAQTRESVFASIEIDMSQTTWMDANMCAPLGAVLYKVGRELNTVRLTNVPHNVEAILAKNGFLCNYGWPKREDTYGSTVEYKRFEPKDDRYARTQDATDLKTSIAKASNYAEGLASTTHGQAGTLGALCNQIGDWPHDKVKEALQSLYKFCSDYPGIRHAGSPGGMRRDLSAKDSTLICLLLLGFTGYLSPNVDERSVLGV